MTSIFRDAEKQVPELAELVAPIALADAVLIDADIEIRWCRREIGLPTFRSRDRRRPKVLEQLGKALDLVAKTEAKTQRETLSSYFTKRSEAKSGWKSRTL